MWGSGGLNHQATSHFQERFTATRKRVAERSLRLSKMHIYNTNYEGHADRNQVVKQDLTYTRTEARGLTTPFLYARTNDHTWKRSVTTHGNVQ